MNGFPIINLMIIQADHAEGQSVDKYENGTAIGTRIILKIIVS